MKSKKNIKPRKMVIDNTMNDEIVDILKKYLNKMDVSYQDMVLSKKIYERISSSYKESSRLHHDYSVTDMSSPCELSPSTFLPQEVIQTIHNTLYYHYRVV